MTSRKLPDDEGVEVGSVSFPMGEAVVNDFGIPVVRPADGTKECRGRGSKIFGNDFECSVATIALQNAVQPV